MEGPVAESGGLQLHFSVPPILRIIYMAKITDRWVRVGDEFNSPIQPWPNQAMYVADTDRAHADDETPDIIVPYSYVP